MVCLGFEPRVCRMEGANESTELRRHPIRTLYNVVAGIQTHNLLIMSLVP